VLNNIILIVKKKLNNIILIIKKKLNNIILMIKNINYKKLFANIVNVKVLILI